MPPDAADPRAGHASPDDASGGAPRARSEEPGRGALVAAGIAAALAGFAGLGVEALLLSAAGLALGYGGSSALGLSTWLAAWALGAGAAACVPPRGRRSFLVLGGVTAALAPVATLAVLALGRVAPAAEARIPLAVLAIAAPAFAQGWFLPWLARGRERVAPLLAANLVGALAGAYVVADVAVGAWGRVGASLLAGAVALAAGVVAPARVSDAPEARTPATPHAGGAPARLGPVAAGWIVGVGVAWTAIVQWILVRLGNVWFGGMHEGLHAVLCASLVALALGAAVAGATRVERVPLVVLSCLAGTAWPFVAHLALSGFDDAPLLARALVLCVPALAPFGALVPAVHAASRGGVAHGADPRGGDPRGPGERLGRLLVHEAWGAALSIPLVHVFVVPRAGLAGAAAVACACGAACAFAARASAPRLGPIALCAALLAGLAAAVQDSPAIHAPPLANPALALRRFAEDRDFAVAVVDDGMLGERTLLTDGFRAAGTGRDYRYMEALGHLPLLLHPAPRHVAVLALGTGTTVGAVALDPRVERLDVLEISRAVVESAPEFEAKNHGVLGEGLPGLLDDADDAARVVVRLGDGRATLAAARGAYDVVTMEPLLPDSPFAVYLYTREFYARTRDALAPGGLVCQWVPPHALEPATFDAVLDAFASSFPWSGAWLFGTQVVLVGGEREPVLDPARFSADAPESVRAARGALGLARVDDVVTRWCGPLPRAGDGARALTDEDPWIVYRPRRHGAELLGDLPANLARFADDVPVPASWRAASSPELDLRLAAARALRRARVAAAEREAVLRGVQRTGAHADDLAARIAYEMPAARRAADVEVGRFAEELEFLDALRLGVAHLAAGPGPELAQRALDPLLRAAELRGERADVHLYCAVALERLRAPAAEKALARAVAACPGLARTPEGLRARALGLSDAAWDRLVAASERAVKLP